MAVGGMASPSGQMTLIPARAMTGLRPMVLKSRTSGTPRTGRRAPHQHGFRHGQREEQRQEDDRHRQGDRGDGDEAADAGQGHDLRPGSRAGQRPDERQELVDRVERDPEEGDLDRREEERRRRRPRRTSAAGPGRARRKERRGRPRRGRRRRGTAAATRSQFILAGASGSSASALARSTGLAFAPRMKIVTRASRTHGTSSGRKKPT